MLYHDPFIVVLPRDHGNLGETLPESGSETVDRGVRRVNLPHGVVIKSLVEFRSGCRLDPFRTRKERSHVSVGPLSVSYDTPSELPAQCRTWTPS